MPARDPHRNPAIAVGAIAETMMSRRRSLIAGALLAALLSTIAVTVVTQLWNVDLHVPFQYAHAPRDDEQDATLDMMLIKNVHEAGWFNRNPKLNAPFKQEWAEWPMGGDLLAYGIKKGIVDTTGDVPLTFNLFWLLTFPLIALVAFPVLRSLRCSWSTAVVGAVLFSLAPYHFRNGVAHENLAFYVGIPIIVLLCMKVLGPDSGLPPVRAFRHRTAWWRIRWLLLGTVLIGVTGIYYLAFLLSLLVICATVGALAHRRPGRLVMALVFGAVGLGASALANLPTLLFRAQRATNILGVPDRQLGVAEFYPLRIVELLSPVTAHRFGPFAALADRLYEPGLQGLGTAQLGLAAAIGFVIAIVALLVRVVRRGDRRGWTYEARLGIVILASLILATKGGVSRALELTGLGGIRAWTRIAIVVAFACIVVFARLLDRVRVGIVRRATGRSWRRPRLAWVSILAVVLVGCVLDQSSPALMPNPTNSNAAMANAAAREHRWHADAAFVARLERRLARGAMVFQLPVADFPEHGVVERMSAHDPIKEGYLHSRSLRWSAGGIRGRSGEWQWPASVLHAHELVRGLSAMGFSGLMVDRSGFPDDGVVEMKKLRRLLGAPIVTSDRRLVAWDLRSAAAASLSGMSSAARHRLVRQMLDAPRLYLATDAHPIVNRGKAVEICARGALSLVNPGRKAVLRSLIVKLDSRLSDASGGHVIIGRRSVPIAADGLSKTMSIKVAPGTTTIKILVETPGVRCESAVPDTLPNVAAKLRLVRK